MRIEQRNIYIAEDGKEFDSEEACKQYEKKNNFSVVIACHIERFADDYYDEDVRMDIAQAIASTFPALIEKYNEL